MTKTEVLGINLSNRPFDIKEYKGVGIVYPLQGYSFLFFRGNKQNLAYLETHENLTMYNLAMAFHSQTKYTQGRYCNFNYVNTTSIIDLELNFDEGMFKSSINGQSCHSYKINRKIFPENKASVSFMGYSTNVSPIQVKVNDLSIYKVVNSTVTTNTTFHSDTHSFINALSTHDLDYAKNISLSNLLLINVC